MWLFLTLGIDPQITDPLGSTLQPAMVGCPVSCEGALLTQKRREGSPFVHRHFSGLCIKLLQFELTWFEPQNSLKQILFLHLEHMA